MWAGVRIRGGYLLTGEEGDKTGHLARPRCVDECCEQFLSLRLCNRPYAPFGQVYAGTPGELAGVGLADREDGGDLAERVVESFAQHVHGTFDL